MSEPKSRLPERASLEQLRKQAKELIKAFRDGDAKAHERFVAIDARFADPQNKNDVTLSHAQFVLAREYGFETWVAIIQHIGTTNPTGLRELEQLAEEVADAYSTGDAMAIREINWTFQTSFPWERESERMLRRLTTWFASESRSRDQAIADARHLVAKQFEADSWQELQERLATKPSASGSPFFRLHQKQSSVEMRGPVPEKSWDSVLEKIREMKITEVNAGGQMADAALERLSRLQHITSLNLGGSKQLTDEGLRYLARLPRLEKLVLSGWESQITDRGLDVLRHLTNLRSINLQWQPNISDAGAASLENCERLEEVVFGSTRTGDGAIAALTDKPHLREFTAGTNVTPAGLGLLHRFPMFKSWHDVDTSYSLMGPPNRRNYFALDARAFTQGGLEKLVGLDGLFALNLSGCVMPASAVAPLVTLPHLEIFAADPTDEAMRHVAAMPRLGKLFCQDTQAGDEGFVALSNSKTLKYIWGRRCHNLRGRGFTALANMQALRGLSVSCKNVDDAALSTLPLFPALREFMPMDVPDEGFRHVGRCKELEELWCMYCVETGDAATEHIASLPKLSNYAAFSTQITDRSLTILGGMKSIKELTFEDCIALTDAGIAAVAKLPHLRKFTIEGSPRVTRAALNAFPEGVSVQIPH